jgi:hypothetical protein
MSSANSGEVLFNPHGGLITRLQVIVSFVLPIVIAGGGGIYYGSFYLLCFIALWVVIVPDDNECCFLCIAKR